MQQFAEYLNEINADVDQVILAMRLFVSEVTDDKTETDMLKELQNDRLEKEAFKKTQESLAKDAKSMEQISLLAMTEFWKDENNHSAIKAAFTNAKNKMPVIEVSILALEAMYGMYLHATKGVTYKETTRILKDGTFEHQIIKKEPFAPISEAVSSMIAKITG